MDKYKNLSIQIPLAILFVILGFFLATKSNKVTLENKSEQSEITLGAPCNQYSNFSKDTNGLQCYFYGEVGGRKGIWIYPDVYNLEPHNYSYQSITSNWEVHKETVDPLNIFSIKIPPGGSIGHDNYGNLTIYVDKSNELNTAIVVTIWDKKYNNVDYFVNGIKESSSQTVVTDNSSLGGQNGKRVDSLSRLSLNYGALDLFSETRDYIIDIHSNKFGDPYLDFISEAVFRSLKINN